MSRLAQDGKTAARLYARFGVRDRIPLEVEPSIQPVVLVEDLTVAGYDQKEIRIAAASTGLIAAGGAGNYCDAVLFNPVNSGISLNLVAVSAYCAAATNYVINVQMTNSELANALVGEAYVTRLGTEPVSCGGKVSWTNLAGPFITISLLDFVPTSIPVPIVGQVMNMRGWTLDPGRGLTLHNRDANVATGFNFIWEEVSRQTPPGQP